MNEIRKKFEYIPISLKDILRSMKRNIDLMIDLAYSAVKFGSEEIADETSRIEHRIHDLTFLLYLQIIQTQVGGIKEAKKLEPIVVMGYSIDKISDALADIAKVVYINRYIGDFTQLFWDKVPEPIVKVTVNENCNFIGLPRLEVHFRSKYGVDLIAIKRGDQWLFGFDETIHKDDILIIKGELELIYELKTLVYDLEPISFRLDEDKRENIFDLSDPEIFKELEDLKNDYVKITDISETMIELALASLFFNSYELAEDMLEMEELMDALNAKFEKDLLAFANLSKNPRILTGIMKIIFSCEQISDAASSIAENIVKGFEPHEIVQKAIEETPEIVVRETVSKKSFFNGKTYAELQNNRYKKGFHIVAMKRENNWIYGFKREFKFQEGDLLIGLGPKETVEQWRYGVRPENSNGD
ncbi:MAG: hypothetical protein JW776_02425 [Candidatus Lokiarchaeota archaeon]|nr:hypothetical protein [Candidatus Lokiarchaeota archaeon]